MRKCTVISLLIILLAVGGAVLVKRCPRTVPLEETSELYRRYIDVPGIDATFIQNYRLSDSVRVDVTLLQATDSAGWNQLQDSLGYARLAPEDREYLMKHKGIRINLIPKGHLDYPMDSVFLNNDMVAIDGTNRTIAIFNLTDSIQYRAIIKKSIRDNKNNKTRKR